MTAPPLPTFIVQDAWYNLTTGQINPSVADTVPNITYLHPMSTPLGPVDGLVGSLDGEVLFLAGTATELDGGQTWLLWDELSMLPDDSANVFNPWVDVAKPGRWRSIGKPSTPATPTIDNRFIKAGATYLLGASSAPFVNVFVQGRIAAGATTINLPGSTFVGQQWKIKDANGDATTYNIITAAGSIDGGPSDTLTIDWAERSYMWNGLMWSVL